MSYIKICSIEGCENIAYRRGWCRAHYARYLRHGNPNFYVKEQHGMGTTKLYRVWAAIVQRVTNPKNKFYHRYGGRGIEICREWRKSFMAFYRWSMANGYQEGLTIDRNNNNGNYEPENCRWVTQAVNNENKGYI
jgi:hypothetical protein